METAKKLLMIVGNADDIFIYNLSKWLKKSMNIKIDIIEYNNSNARPKSYDYKYYDNVDTFPQWYLFCKIPFLRRYSLKYTLDWTRSIQLCKMLKGRHYDIIHCHYVLGLYANADYLKKYCDKLYFTFWGGEWTHSLYWGSNNLFKDKYIIFFKKYADGLVNGSIRTAEKMRCNDWLPLIYRCTFGSAPLEKIFEMQTHEDRKECKSYWKIPNDKVAVQLGYSAKQLHQYLEIIEELEKHDELKNKLHLVAPMTRGENGNYIHKVRRSLEDSGFSFTLIDRHLDDEEMAKYRCSIDVVLQLSTFDGYSRSIVEAFCAGSAVVYGEWLNYEVKLEEDGFIGYSVNNISDGINVIKDLLNDTESVKIVCNNNILKGKSKYLWSDCIKDWVAVYTGTASPLTVDK